MVHGDRDAFHADPTSPSVDCRFSQDPFLVETGAENLSQTLEIKFDLATQILTIGHTFLLRNSLTLTGHESVDGRTIENNIGKKSSKKLKQKRKT